MPIPIGIDLGTTNCCMAWIQGGRLTVFKDEHNRTTMPSLVAQTTSGELLVGWRARACKDPHYRHGFAKRALGSTQRYQLADGDVAAHTISGRLLKELKLRAERELGGEVAAIITVPAHFQEIHREETKQAAAEAELQVIDLLVEPIAAAVAYYQQQREAVSGALADETILVFDLGGGTMDATVCVRHGTHIEVGAQGRAYEGDKYLGGLDFDKALLGLAAEQLIGQGFTIETLGNDLPTSQWLWEALSGAERCKHELSRDEEVQWRQEFDQGDRHAVLDLWVTRPKFEGTIAHLLDRTLAFCDGALCTHQSEITSQRDVDDRRTLLLKALESLDRIILVGGSTLVPAVRRRIAEHYRELSGRDIEIISFRPHECVAMGAAVFASMRRERGAERRVGSITWLSGPHDQVGGEVAHHPDLRGVVTRGIGGTVDLVCAGGVLSAGIDTGGRFLIPPFPLEPGSNELTLSLFDSAGQLIETVLITVMRGGISISEPGLAHPIKLRLIEGLDELVPAGTRSGSAVVRQLYLNDGSARAHCPLFEGHLPIGQLEFEAGASAGTPVSLRAVHEGGRLAVQVEVQGRVSQKCEVVLESIQYVGERKTLLHRFQECQRRVEFLIDQLPPNSEFTQSIKTELQALSLDIESEFANPIVADLHRIDDRIRHMEMLDVRLQSFRLTREGVTHRLAQLREDILSQGAEPDIIQELENIERTLPVREDTEVLEALHSRLDRVVKRIYLKHPPVIDESMVDFLVRRIRIRLESLRRDAVTDEVTRQVEEIEKGIERLLIMTHIPTVVHRLWLLEQDLINPLFQRVVIQRSQEGLLRRSPH